MKIILFADGPVGHEICTWLVDQYKGDVSLIVSIANNEINQRAEEAGIPSVVFSTDQDLLEMVSKLGLTFDFGFLAWWPFIISSSLIEMPKSGFINTHPSMLPYNRGKHYNFWALVEQAPFGVSLHFVEKGIDCGDVVAQTPIVYGWEDNGGTLYQKATQAMVELFKNTYPILREGRISRQSQDLGRGTFHFSNELDSASYINLDAQYRARDLLNLLRARTFPEKPSCWFKDEDGVEFEVRIEIRKKNP
jgi:methionyl-tRNA formyltransferase